MNLRILDSIIHGALKPWKLNIEDRELKQLLHRCDSIHLSNNASLNSRISTLMSNFPRLIPVMINNQPETEVKELHFSIKHEDYYDTITKFYSQLIISETLRVFNTSLSVFCELSNETDIVFQLNRLMNDIKVLNKQVYLEVEERGQNDNIGNSKNLTLFTLNLLNTYLAILFFSLQKEFGDYLKPQISIRDYFLIELEQTDILQLIDRATLDNPKVTSELSGVSKLQMEALNSENKEIEEIEIALRKFIIDKYQIDSVSKFNVVIPPHIQKKIKEAIEREVKKNPALVNEKGHDIKYRLELLDLQELQTILVTPSNWAAVQNYFGTKENLAIEFNNLSGLRNPIRHSRAIDNISLLKGKAAIEWFKQQLGMC